MSAVRRHWWTLGAGILVGVVIGLIVFVRSTPVYAATASVLVEPASSVETEAQVARASIAGHRVDVRVVPGTAIIEIRYEAPTPAVALTGAMAAAQSYVDGRTGTVVGQPVLPVAPVSPDPWLYLSVSGAGGLLAGASLVLVRERMSRRVARGIDVIRRHNLPVLMELTGDDTSAPAPSEPVRRTRSAPTRTPGFASLGVGAVAYPGAAYVDGDRSEQTAGRPVGPRQLWAFNRMRNEIVARLGADDRILLIVGASVGAASTVVAANLAAAFARADLEVVLLGANAAEIGNESVTLSHIFDVADIPGLTDVLTGRASLTRAMQRAARSPRLRVITPGGTATASGLLQSEGARGALHALRRIARFVVVDAPSAAAGADAQSLAATADAAIIVAEAGRTRHTELADASEQLRQVGTHVLGVALINRAGMVVETAPYRPTHQVTRAHELDTWLSGSRSALDAPTAPLAQIVSPPPREPASSS